jgi:hypothetical protein
VAEVVRPTETLFVVAGPAVVPIRAGDRAAAASILLLVVGPVAGWAAGVPSRAGSPIGRARQAYLRREEGADVITGV